MLSSASALTSCSMRSGNWLYVVEELLLRDRERLEDVHGEDTLEKSGNVITNKTPGLGYLVLSILL